MITGYMNRACKTEGFFGRNRVRQGSLKFGVDKIALFSLFVIGLLAARLIISSRSALLFTEPIELDYAGLSVSVPAGNGWQSERQWNYQKNGFVLSSVFSPGSTIPIALVRCWFLLAEKKMRPDIRLEQKASAVDGEIVKTGQIWVNTSGLRFAEESRDGTALAVDWASVKGPLFRENREEGHPKKQKMPFDVFFGVAALPNDRQLDIEVHQIAGERDLAERIFRRIVESLAFKGNQLIEAGSEIVAEIKSTGVDSFLDRQSRQEFFLIKDARDRPIGFTMDVFVDFGPETQLNIRAASFLYIRSRYTQEQVTFFQGSNNLEEFIWRSEIVAAAGKSGTEMVLDESGVMTVKKYGIRLEEENYHLGPAAIPDILGGFIFSPMLLRGCKEIFVDIVGADGKILPVLIYRIEDKDIGADEKAAYVFRVELLDGRGFSELVYFDDEKQIFKRLIRHEGVYVLERSSSESILREFPERADYILKRKKMLEQNMPQE